MPPPTTSVSTCAWRCSVSTGASSSSESRPTPGRPAAASPSTSSTAVAATIGSERGADTSTKAHGSSTPAEKTPRGRPRIGLEQITSTPLARRADASVSPSNPSYVRPSNRNPIGFDRSIQVPPDSRRLEGIYSDPSERDASNAGGSRMP